jgi:5-dehydro-2-deoxygluconokinase
MLERLRRNSFLVLGRAGMDFYADPPGSRTEEAVRFTSALGGSAANIAAGIVRLGGAASLVSTVSDDAVGRYVQRELMRYGIDTSHVNRAEGQCRTSLAVVETRAEDCQSVIYRNGAADFQLNADQVRGLPMDAYGALIVTGTALAMEPSRSATFLAIRLAREAEVPVILDIDYRPYSWANAADAAATCRMAAEASDFTIGNDVEWDVVAGGSGGLALSRELASGRAATIYKMGEKGSISFAADTRFETPIFRVTALKPTGAGDAFMAGVVTGLAAGLDLSGAVRRGSAAAAIVVTRVGCAPASPTAEELDNFMRDNARPA